MLKITDFADQGGVDRLVYFVEEIWGTLHPDCGPNDLEAIEEEAAVVIAERDRLRRELEKAKAELKDIREQVTEWVCDKCNWCYPGPPQNGAACVQCPRCLGLCGPRFVVQYHRAQRELDETKAERDEIKAELAAAGALLSPSDPHVSLPEAIAELQAEIARMRPVVEAAKDFCHEHYPGCSWDCPHPSPQCRFNRAVVTYFGEDAVYPIPEEGE